MPDRIGPLRGPNIAVNPKDPQVAYFGSSIGVYRYNDRDGTAHLRETGMVNTYINDVTVNPKDPSVVYAGGDQGLWKSEDSGNSWHRLDTCHVNVVAVDPQHPDTVYWGGHYSLKPNLMRSYDWGESWEGIQGAWSGSITALEVHPDNSNIVFVASYPSTVYKSTDRGDNWLLSFSLPHGALRIKDIAISKTDPEIVYFAGVGTGDGLYRSEDGGVTWNWISDPGIVLSVALHPALSETLYAATRHDIKASYDGGQSFQSIGSPILGEEMSTIDIDKVNPSNLLVGTKDKGVFLTENGGQSWTRLEGPYDLRVTDLHYVPQMKQLFVSTHGDGVWRGDGIALGIPPGNKQLRPVSFTLEQPYPNPFNARTMILFFVPKKIPVTLSIYDIKGQFVTELAHRLYSPGYHFVSWDGTDVFGIPSPSGIYILRFDGISFSRTKKITLLR